MTTQESTEYRNLIDKYKMGFNCQCENAEDLAEKISILIKDKELRRKMGENARKCAEEKFDRQNSYFVIADAIMN